jgi:hypothetical protein
MGSNPIFVTAAASLQIYLRLMNENKNLQNCCLVFQVAGWLKEEILLITLTDWIDIENL